MGARHGAGGPAGRPVRPRLPAPLVAVLLATAAVSLFGLADRLDVVGSIDTGVPVPALPDAGV